MPKLTVRFYTASDIYTGWKYLNEITYFEIRNWLASGNYLKHKESVIRSTSTQSQIFALLRKGKH